MPYCRSWTFNVGEKQARGSVIVLHDNDMLVPADYSSQILTRVAQGYEVVNLKRYIFYLNESHTRSIFDEATSLLKEAPEAIVQNLEAGGSVAITRDAYERIGGMDESFIGWGGEDNEFWERAQTCKVWPYGYLPIVHLWHPAQPGKQHGDNHTLKHYQRLSGMPAQERVAILRKVDSGQKAAPSGYVVAAVSPSNQ
jgi:GT2 family glycosyltransferase